MFKKTVAIFFATLGLVVFVRPCDAQQPIIGQQVQLPTVSFFNVRTVVSVPDGGITHLGGVSRHSSGRISRGMPGASGPWGRPFQNRSSGYSTASSNSNARVRLILARELEKEVMAEANRRHAVRQANDLNGSPAVRRKADFISRNIGRSSNRHD